MNCITVNMMIVQKKNPMNKTQAYKSILCLILSLALCLAFCACGGEKAAEPSETPAGSHVSDGAVQGDIYGTKAEVENPFDDPDYESIFINAVKDGVPANYPEITIGEAFDQYFASPEWRAFEGADSYHDDTLDYIVEFTGGCTYEGAEAQALIQFTISREFDSFETTFFSLDGDPMTFAKLNELMEVAFYSLSQEQAG